MIKKKTWKHLDYNPTTFFDDVAIIKLSKNITLNEYIQVACLPIYQSDNYPSTQVDAYTAGWGDTSENGSFTNTLNNVKMYVYPDPEPCEQIYKSLPKNWRKQLCSGDVNGGRDSCNDDGGGAVFIKDKIGSKTKYVIAGMNGYGFGCGRPGIAR